MTKAWKAAAADIFGAEHKFSVAAGQLDARARVFQRFRELLRR